MDFKNMFEYILETFDLVLVSYQSVIDFFFTEHVLLEGVTFTNAVLVLGAGLTVLLTLIIGKWGINVL